MISFQKKGTLESATWDIVVCTVMLNCLSHVAEINSVIGYYCNRVENTPYRNLTDDTRRRVIYVLIITSHVFYNDVMEGVKRV